jgi:endonuclease IV
MRKKKRAKTNPYYTPATWNRPLRKKLERGDRAGDLLRYTHKKEQYPEEVKEFIQVAAKIQQATELLATLTTGSMAPLQNSVGEKLPSAAELAKVIERLKQIQPDIDVQIRDHLLKIVPKD